MHGRFGAFSGSQIVARQLERDLARGEPPLQSSRRGQVESLLAFARQAFLHHLHQRLVVEPHQSGLALREDATGQQQIDLSVDVTAHDAGQKPGIEAAPQHGRGFGHLERLGLESAETALDRLAHRHGDARAPGGGARQRLGVEVPEPPLQLETALAGESLEDFGHEQRVARGLLVQLPGRLRILTGGAQHRAHHGFGLLQVERLQSHGGAPSPLHQLGQPRALVHGLHPVAGHEQAVGQLVAAHQVEQEFQAGGVGPLQVVHQQQAPTAGRQQARHPLEEVELLHRILAARRRIVGLREIGQQDAQSPPERRQLGRKLNAGRLPQHGDPVLVGQSFELVAIAPGHELVGGVVGQLLQQPGLAHSALARHQSQQGALLGRLHQVQQAVQLDFAAHELAGLQLGRFGTHEVLGQLPFEDAAPGVESLLGAVEAVGRILGEELHDELVELGGKPGKMGAGRRRIFHQDVMDGGHRIGGRERELAGQRLVEDDPEAVEVPARVHLAGGEELGRHVVGRPHHGAGLGELVTALQPAGESKVQQAWRAVLGIHQNVLGLEVAMHDAPAVQVGQRLEQPGHDLLEPLAISVDELADVLARDEVHRVVGLPLRNAAAVDSHQPGMA